MNLDIQSLAESVCVSYQNEMLFLSTSSLSLSGLFDSMMFNLLLFDCLCGFDHRFAICYGTWIKTISLDLVNVKSRRVICSAYNRFRFACQDQFWGKKGLENQLNLHWFIVICEWLDVRGVEYERMWKSNVNWGTWRSFVILIVLRELVNFFCDSLMQFGTMYVCKQLVFYRLLVSWCVFITVQIERKEH